MSVEFKILLEDVTPEHGAAVASSVASAASLPAPGILSQPAPIPAGMPPAAVTSMLLPAAPAAPAGGPPPTTTRPAGATPTAAAGTTAAAGMPAVIPSSVAMTLTGPVTINLPAGAMPAAVPTAAAGTPAAAAASKSVYDPTPSPLAAAARVEDLAAGPASPLFEAVEAQIPTLEEAPAPFDPYAEAQKRIDAEKKAKAVKDAYEDLNPPMAEEAPSPPSFTSALAGILGKMGLGNAASAVSSAGGAEAALAGGGAGVAGGAAAGAAGSAGAAAGGLSGLAGTAATAIPIIGAVVAGVKIFEAQLSSAREIVDLFGKDMKSLANNDYMGILEDHFATAKHMVEKIPIIGGLLSEGMELAIAPLRAFTGAVEAFVERGKQLAPYSADLSMAGAMAEVRSLMSDIREADQLGPGMARLTDAQSRIWSEFRELFLPVKRVIIEMLVPILEGMLDRLETAGERMKILLDAIQATLNQAAQFNMLLGPVALGFNEIRKAANKYLEENEPNVDTANLMDRILTDAQVAGIRATVAARQGQAPFSPVSPVGIIIPAVAGGF